jgi:hypothetical protein
MTIQSGKSSRQLNKQQEQFSHLVVNAGVMKQSK